MGCYVNPPGMSKDLWLEQSGVQISRAEVQEHGLGGNLWVVCLMRNTGFSAALVVTDESDRAAVLDPGDLRPKTFYLVEAGKLRTVSPFVLYVPDNAGASE